MSNVRDFFAKGFDGLVSEFARGVESVRHEVVERGVYGRTVTPRAMSITLGSASDDLSPAEQLGWFQRSDPAAQSQTPPLDRGVARQANTSDHGIDR